MLQKGDPFQEKCVALYEEINRALCGQQNNVIAGALGYVLAQIIAAQDDPDKATEDFVENLRRDVYILTDHKRTPL